MAALAVLTIFFVFLIEQVQADVSQCPGITVPAADMDTVSVWTDGVTSRLGIAKPSATATASSITAKTASMLRCPSDCSIALITFVTSVGSQNSFLQIQEPLSVLVPGYFTRFPSTDNLRCVPYDGFCGATIPLYRHYRVTSFGIQHAYSFSPDVSYQNFQMEANPVCYFWETGTVAADPSSVALGNIPLSELASFNSFDNEASNTMKDHYTSTLTSVLGYTEGTPLGKVAVNNSGKCDELVALVQMVDQQTGAFGRLDHKLVLEGQEPNRLFEQYTTLPEKVFCVARPVCGATVPLWKMYDYVNLDSIMATSPTTTSTTYLYPNAPLCYIWDTEYSTETTGSNGTSTGGGLVVGEVTVPGQDVRVTATVAGSTEYEFATTVSVQPDGTTVAHESSGNTETGITVLSSEGSTLSHESSIGSTGSEGTTVSHDTSSGTTVHVPAADVTETTSSPESGSSVGSTVHGSEETTVPHDVLSGTTIVSESTLSHDSGSTAGFESTTVSHDPTRVTGTEAIGSHSESFESTNLSPEITGVTVSYEATSSTAAGTIVSEETSASHGESTVATMVVSDVSATTVSPTASHEESPVTTVSVPMTVISTVSHSESTSGIEVVSTVPHEEAAVETTTASTATTFPNSPFTVNPGESGTTMSTTNIFEGATATHEAGTATGSEGTTAAVTQDGSVSTIGASTTTVSHGVVSTVGSTANGPATSTVFHDGTSGTTLSAETTGTTISHDFSGTTLSGTFSDLSGSTTTVSISTMSYETMSSSGTDHDMITVREIMEESSSPHGISTTSPTFTMIMEPTTTVLPTSFIDIIENIQSSIGISGTTESLPSSGSDGTIASQSHETSVSHDSISESTTLTHDSMSSTVNGGQETTVSHDAQPEGTPVSQVTESGQESTTGTTTPSTTTGPNAPVHDVPSTWEQFFPPVATAGSTVQSTGETTMSHEPQTTSIHSTEATTRGQETTVLETLGTVSHDSGLETTVNHETETTTGTIVSQATTTVRPITSPLPGSFLPSITVTRPSWMGGGVALEGAASSSPVEGSSSSILSTFGATVGHESVTETSQTEMTTTYGFGFDGTTSIVQESSTPSSTDSHNSTSTAVNLETILTTTTLDSTDLFNLNG